MKMLSMAKLQVVAVAGGGALAASFVQAAVPPTTLTPFWRDIALSFVAAAAAGWGGETLRPFALGFGAVAAGSVFQSFIAPA